MKTVQKTETRREPRYVLQERDAATNEPTNGPDDWTLPTDLGTDWCKAWHVWRNALAVFPERYTPHAPYRLVILAEDGAS